MGAERRIGRRGTPDGREVDDGLEPPTLRPGLLYAVGFGGLAFVLAAMAVLLVFYQLFLKNPARQPVHAFPEPRLETSIDPRERPATPEPGPAPPTLRRPPAEPASDMDRAMRAVVARGQQAYDPLPAPARNPTR